MNLLPPHFFRHFLYCSLLLCTSLIWGQQALPDGRFLEPETKVGQPIHYILKYKHSPNQEVLFPDSTYDFTPFELVDKQFFPTRTEGAISIDSVVYTLATYETDLRQGLSLPIFMSSTNDPDGKMPIFAKSDSIDLEPLIQEMPDSLILFEDTQIAHVSREFNYPYLLIGLLAVFISIVLAVALFGKKVQQGWKLKRLKKKYQKFVESFDQIQGKGGQASVAPAITLWKTYTGQLMGRPLTSYTTKEIAGFITSPKVLESLRYADRVMYAGTFSEERLSDHLNALKAFTQEVYEQKVQAIKAEK